MSLDAQSFKSVLLTVVDVLPLVLGGVAVVVLTLCELYNDNALFLVDCIRSQLRRAKATRRASRAIHLLSCEVRFEDQLHVTIFLLAASLILHGVVLYIHTSHGGSATAVEAWGLRASSISVF